MLLGARASWGSIRSASFSFTRRRALARRRRTKMIIAARMRQAPKNERIGIIIRSVLLREDEDEDEVEFVVEFGFAIACCKGYL